MTQTLMNRAEETGDSKQRHPLGRGKKHRQSAELTAVFSLLFVQQEIVGA